MSPSPVRPTLRVSYDETRELLSALEPGRTAESQPEDCWQAMAGTVALLHDRPGGRCVGFIVHTFESFDPDDTELPDQPRFDVPRLALTDASLGTIIRTFTDQIGPSDTLDRTLVNRAIDGAIGPEVAEGRWRACLESGEPTAHHGLGYTLLHLGRADEALPHLHHYATIAPADAWAWCYYGRAAHATGAHDEARTAYGRAIELDGHEDDPDCRSDADEGLAALEAGLSAPYVGHAAQDPRALRPDDVDDHPDDPRYERDANGYQYYWEGKDQVVSRERDGVASILWPSGEWAPYHTVEQLFNAVPTTPVAARERAADRVFRDGAKDLDAVFADERIVGRHRR
ncbi:MAG: tetratricopeptide repeat protein [Solirubrobacteraceae bacterium]